eukprot:1521232-Rhodomonas_salina.2
MSRSARTYVSGPTCTAEISICTLSDWCARFQLRRFKARVAVGSTRCHGAYLPVAAARPAIGTSHGTGPARRNSYPEISNACWYVPQAVIARRRDQDPNLNLYQRHQLYPGTRDSHPGLVPQCPQFHGEIKSQKPQSAYKVYRAGGFWYLISETAAPKPLLGCNKR